MDVMHSQRTRQVYVLVQDMFRSSSAKIQKKIVNNQNSTKREPTYLIFMNEHMEGGHLRE